MDSQSAAVTPNYRMNTCTVCVHIAETVQGATLTFLTGRRPEVQHASTL